MSDGKQESELKFTKTKAGKALEFINFLAKFKLQNSCIYCKFRIKCQNHFFMEP